MKKFKSIINEERKESAKVADAFLAKKKAKGKRSHTDGSALYLHGNKIAWHGEGGKVHATMAGWATVTTRDRLNTVASRIPGGKKFHQKKGKQHYGDQEVGSKDVIDLNEGTIEKIDEISKELATRYFNKANDQELDLTRKYNSQLYGGQGKKITDQIRRKYKNRRDGMDLAYKRMWKDRLEELNVSTLRRYINKAVIDHSDAARHSGIDIARKKDNSGNEKRIIKRNLGIARAVDKLSGIAKVKARLREEEQIDEKHTAAQLYSKEKKHRTAAETSDGKKAKRHAKAKEVATRLLASLKVSGKKSTKEL